MWPGLRQTELWAPGEALAASLVSRSPDTWAPTGTGCNAAPHNQSLLSPSKRSSQTFRRFTSDSMPELVPAAKVVRSETQVSHRLCHRLHSDGALEGREPQSQLQSGGAIPEDGSVVPCGGGEAGLWQNPRQGQWQNSPPHLSPRGWGLQALEAGREVLCPLPGQLPPEGGPPHPSRGR